MIIRTAAQGAKRADFDRELQVPLQAARGAPAARRVGAGAGDGLPGGRPRGARRTRHLLGGVRARARRRRARPPPPDLVPHPHRPRAGGARRALQGRHAAVRALRRRGRPPGNAFAARRPAQRGLSDDRLHRGADRHRRQLRLVHRSRQERAAGGHDHQDQPRGGRRGRQSAAAARHRRDHRHRLHRHGAGPQPRRRPQDAAPGRSTRIAPRPSSSRSRRSASSR